VKRVECVREQDVLRAVLSRGWRGHGDPELKRHAEACRVCREITQVAALLGRERDEALRDVHVPEAGQIWWRAAVRAHAESAQAARRPMIWLQGIVGASTAGVVAALVGIAWPSIREAVAWFAAFGARFEFDAPNIAPLMDTLQPALLLGLVAVACLVLTPILVYFALSDD